MITAIAAAYEAFCRLADQVPLKGWDQGMLAVGAARGAGKSLGLDRSAMGNAISIAITFGIPTAPAHRTRPSGTLTAVRFSGRASGLPGGHHAWSREAGMFQPAGLGS